MAFPHKSAWASLLAFTAACVCDATAEPLRETRNLIRNNPAVEGWLGYVIRGSGSVTASDTTSANMTGLCMSAPAAGENIIGWTMAKPPGDHLLNTYANSIRLIDGNLYRINPTFSSDVGLAERTPYLAITAENTPFEYDTATQQLTPVSRPVYSGELKLLDNGGGANRIRNCVTDGVGSALGRNTFEFWFAPSGMKIKKWIDSAFTEGNDAYNDFIIHVRVLDQQSLNLGGELDSGLICLREISVISMPLGSMLSSTSSPIVYTAKVNVNGLTAQPGNQGVFGYDCLDTSATSGGSIFRVRSGRDYKAKDANKRLRPMLGNTLTITGNPEEMCDIGPTSDCTINEYIYPIQWQENQLYVMRAKIHAVNCSQCTAVANLPACDPNNPKPVDVIQMSAFGPTLEIIANNFMSSGHGSWLAPNGEAELLAGPPPEASALATEEYLGFFYSHSFSLKTNSALGQYHWARYWSPLLQFLNVNPDFKGEGTDAFKVKSWEVQNLTQALPPVPLPLAPISFTPCPTPLP